MKDFLRNLDYQSRQLVGMIVPLLKDHLLFYTVLVTEGSNPREVESKHDALKLNLKLHEDQSIHFFIGGGFINIDVPKNDSERYFINAENLSDSIRGPHRQAGCAAWY
ncbi:hypothetical protein [Alishewanella longhuensis]